MFDQKKIWYSMCHPQNKNLSFEYVCMHAFTAKSKKSTVPKYFSSSVGFQYYI